MSAARAAAAVLAALALSSAPLACRSVFRGGEPGSAHAMSPEAARALEQATNLAAGGDAASALSVLDPYLDEEAEIVPVHRLHQDLRLRAEPRSAVVERYRERAERRPTARAFLLLARVLPPGDEGDGLLDRAVTLAPEDPWAHYARGYRDRTLGRLESAGQSLERALELDPDFPEALLEAGEVAYLLHDEEAATERLSHLHDLAPDDRSVTLALTAVLSERQEFESAERILRASLERRPADADVEIALTSVLVDRGRYEEASRRLDSLSERLPKDPIVAFNRAVVAEVHERDYTKALELYERYLTLGGEDALRVSRWIEKIRAGDVGR